ncbi:uncharacterized protein LOC143277565 [Babylonia areolata]|uniref:uncharacterized protein LOC143277565 n=1 Tax=Babylonia areolata TaxID=304850 RepID=UPI003FD2BCC2
MVSVADEEGRLVLMGVDATYCVVDEVDTTVAISDHFLHQAIEDAESSVKKEPVASDSDSEVQRDSRLDQVDKGTVVTEHIKTEHSSENPDGEACKGEGPFTPGETSLLRAVLQRKPVSLREPEKAQVVSAGTQDMSSTSSQSRNVDIIDSATGKVVTGPVFKHKGKRKPPCKSSGDGTPETVADNGSGEGGGGKEKGESSESVEGKARKGKRSREKPYQCGVCFRWFGCKSHVVEHMRTHTGEKPFKCPLCHKRFSQKSNIHQHMNTHTMQRPFRCDDCGKDFMYRGSLYKHKRLHTGERPYTCGDCMRRFTHASQLFEHMRTHTNERPFKCGVCGRAFAHSGTMHRHQRNHFSQVKGKGVVEGEKGVKEGVVSDINHNTPSYRSRMEGRSPPEDCDPVHKGLEPGSQVTDHSSGMDQSQQDLDQSISGVQQSRSELEPLQKISRHSPGDSSLAVSPVMETDVGSKNEEALPLSTPDGVARRSTNTFPSKDRPRTAKRTSPSQPSAERPSPRSASRRKKATAAKSQLSDKGQTDLSSVPTSSIVRSDSGLYPSVAGMSDNPSQACSESTTKTAAEEMEFQHSATPTEEDCSVKEQNQTVKMLLALPSPPSTTADDESSVVMQSSSSNPGPGPKPASKTSSKRGASSSPEDGQKKKRTRLETPDLKIFTCDLCGRGFCHRRSVKRHKLATHADLMAGEGEGKVGRSDVHLQGEGVSGQQLPGESSQGQADINHNIVSTGQQNMHLDMKPVASDIRQKELSSCDPNDSADVKEHLSVHMGGKTGTANMPAANSSAQNGALGQDGAFEGVESIVIKLEPRGLCVPSPSVYSSEFSANLPPPHCVQEFVGDSSAVSIHRALGHEGIWEMDPLISIVRSVGGCLRRLLHISYKEHKTNDCVRNLVSNLVGPQEPLLATVKRWKMAWFGPVIRHNTLSKTILQGTVEGGRRRGRQRKSWSDNVKEWTKMTMPDLLTTAANRTAWSAVLWRNPSGSWVSQDN